MDGLEKAGVRLCLQDFKAVYAFLDREGSGAVDFKKFCRLNLDQGSWASKPPLAKTAAQLRSVAKWGSVVEVPKNKDMNSFTQEIQGLNQTESLKKMRRSWQLPGDSEFAFGLRNE